MSLKHSYTLLSFIYDPLIAQATAHWRQHSLNLINTSTDQKVLINGIGSGLDIPHITADSEYTGTDITPAMLKKAQQRADQSSYNISLLQADCMDLPFADNSFDVVVMHLILAVVPDNTKALKEACRVLKPGGRIQIFDKFLSPGAIAPIRRFINIFSRHIATRTDVVFETLLSECPELSLTHEEPALAKGWFRFILLEKNK
ncbi:MAG: class I SAM-dependent methyltransferase [Gammaproteobacteria bacterium]|nr:class I SAM-dependent methyltransferase [Gammaproteobacteria bacterium]